jgi:hypothetical protein
MSEIPKMKCPNCGAPMEYCGGPSDTNIFIMICTATGCHYQGTYYAEAEKQAQKQTQNEHALFDSVSATISPICVPPSGTAFAP